MDQFPLEQIVERTGSRFAVAVAAAKRAKQIKDGSPPLVEIGSKNPLTIAMSEIAQGKVLIVPTEGVEEEIVTSAFEQYFAGREGVIDEPLPYRRTPRETRAGNEAIDLDDDADDDDDDSDDDDLDDDDDDE